jgi:glycosyltransferase involved in cell wall biosynthesis
LKTAKVSICIPAYQRPDTFRRTLRSVLIQSFDDYEIIITDDSSDNAVAEVVKDFLPNSKINYYKNVERKGTPENWNEAIRRARGDYIKLLHHDDWFKDNDGLGNLLASVEKSPDAILGFCACEVCKPDGSFSYLHAPTARQLSGLKRTPYCLFGNNFIGSPSVTIFRKLSMLEFDRALQWTVDVDFYIRLLNQPSKFAYCEKPLICTNGGDLLQVSAHCSGNRAVEVPEWLHLYQKFSPFQRMKSANLLFLWRLFREYDIRSREDLIACGATSHIPAILSTLLATNRLAHCFFERRK